MSKNIPEQYRPLSMWAYFGYNLLYSVPVIGWIFLIINSFDDSNLNRRNFSRSFFVVYILAAIFFGVLTLTGALAAWANSIYGN